MIMVLTLRSGVQLRFPVTEYTTKRDVTGDLGEVVWTAPAGAPMRLSYIDLDQVVAVHREEDAGVSE